MKRCPKCGASKSPEEFSVDRSKRDGRCVHCKACQSARKKALWADPAQRAVMSAANRRWHAENPEKNTARTRQWAESEKGEAYRDVRRAAGVPTAGSLAYHTERLIVLERADGACELCGLDVDPLDFTVDHIVPTSAGGLHILDNLQLAHRSCNSEKGMAA